MKGEDQLSNHTPDFEELPTPHDEPEITPLYNRKRARNTLEPEKTRKKTRPTKTDIMGEISELRTLAIVLNKDTIRHRKEKDQKNELESKNTDLGARIQRVEGSIAEIKENTAHFQGALAQILAAVQNLKENAEK